MKVSVQVEFDLDDNAPQDAVEQLKVMVGAAISFYTEEILTENNVYDHCEYQPKITGNIIE